MAGSEHHGQLRMSFQDAGPSVEERFLLVFERAACHYKSQIAGQGSQLAGGFRLSSRMHIELQVSGHCDALRQAADGFETFRVGLALRQHR